MLTVLRILEYLLSCNFNYVFVQLGAHDPLQRDRGTNSPHLAPYSQVIMGSHYNVLTSSSHTTQHTTGTILVIHN